MAFAMWEFISVFCPFIAVIYLLGAYLTDVMQAKPMKVTIFFKWIEQPIYAVLNRCQANWDELAAIFRCFVLSNVLLFGVSVTILMRHRHGYH